MESIFQQQRKFPLSFPSYRCESSSFDIRHDRFLLVSYRSSIIRTTPINFRVIQNQLRLLRLFSRVRSTMEEVFRSRTSWFVMSSIGVVDNRCNSDFILIRFDHTRIEYMMRRRNTWWTDKSEMKVLRRYAKSIVSTRVGISTRPCVNICPTLIRYSPHPICIRSTSCTSSTDRRQVDREIILIKRMCKKLWFQNCARVGEWNSVGVSVNHRDREFRVINQQCHRVIVISVSNQVWMCKKVNM